MLTDAPDLHAAFALLDTFFDAQQQEQQIPGLSAALVHYQTLLWHNGFGRADQRMQTPATAHTLYAVGSIDKLFTATMLLQLRDRGLVSLDEPLTRYLPDWTFVLPDGQAGSPTFRQVLAHVSGLPRDQPAAGPQASTTVELLDPPWTRIHYSNFGFALVDQACERISGQPVAAYLQAQVFDPLWTEHSGYPVQATFGADRRMRLATPYQRTRIDVAPTPAGAADGLYCSVDDLARFISLHCRTDSHAPAPVVHDSSLREMQAPVFLDASWQHGMALGWELMRVEDETALHKGGSVGGFAADLLVLPGLKVGLALAMNTTADKSALNRAALELVLPVLRQALQQQAMRAPPDTIPPEWTRYQGRYAGTVGDFVVRWTPTTLVAVIWNTEVALERRGEHQFRMASGPFAGEGMEFVVTSDGHVRAARSSGHTFDRVDE